MVRLQVGYFLNKTEGSRDTFELDEPQRDAENRCYARKQGNDVVDEAERDFSASPQFLFMPGDDVTLLSPITAKGTLLKLPHEITVHLEDLTTQVELTCSRCLRHFPYTISIPSGQRQFIIDTPEEDIGQDEDVFYVNKRTNEIDLSDMIREEILLHFPSFPVCSESCKGLCEKCGANLNEIQCQH